MTMLDYSIRSGPVSVHLGAHTASLFSATDDGLTLRPSMIRGQNGWSATPLFSVGDTVGNGTTAYRPIGRLDGIAFEKLNSSTVRLLVNHEVDSLEGNAFKLANGTILRGARIDYLDMDVATKAIIGGGLAFNEIHNRANKIVTSSADLEGGGFSKFCSSVLVRGNEFGVGQGITESIYFAGEERTLGAGGTEWALDPDTGKLWALPDFGRGRWENIAQVKTGDTSHVAFLLGNDALGGALYMYVGTKVPGGDFLARNGLSGGKFYAWAADSGDTTAKTFAAGSRLGHWERIAVRDINKANTSGYDNAGYKTATKLAIDADAAGAFSFARVEDIDRAPGYGGKFVFAVTGNAVFDGGSNTAGIIHSISVDLSNLAAPTATIKVMHNANTAAGRPIRSPDNVEWSADGWIYIQEDKAAPIFGTSTESSVLRLNPANGIIERIAIVNRNAISPSITDKLADIKGAWETTGIIDVSAAFGKAAGTIFLSNVMAHGVAAGGLVEGGQLVLLAKPGDDEVPGVTVVSTGTATGVIGTKYADQLAGDSQNNIIGGRGGNDVICGGAGNDKIYGGTGSDTISGGSGADRFVLLNPAQGGDRITYFSSSDILVFDNAGFGFGTFSGTMPSKVFRSRTDNHALDLDDRFIFRTTDDTLWFDQDGSGNSAPTLLVTLNNDYTLSVSDMMII
jgi:Ca2+-binding RTX toxin-like protein